MRTNPNRHPISTLVTTVAAAGAAALLTCPAPARAQVGTWNVEGRVTAVACLAGQCASQSQRVSGTSTLEENGTYRSPNPGGGCLGDVPDEVGTWQLEEHNRIVFEPTNVDEIIAAIEICYPGLSFEFRDYRNKGKLKRGGQLLKGKARLRGRVSIAGRRVAAKAVMRWKGTPAAASAAAARTAAATPGLAALLERLARE
jgi:hypothetical protein